MAKMAGLGKGYNAIFLENNITENNSGITKIKLTQIEAKSNQPRKHFDEVALQALADSISTHGVIQPIIVRELASGRYQIIAGERRYRAAKMAGLIEIPTIIIDADELKTSQIALIENIQRENLNPLEEAMAYRSLAEQFDMTQEEISKQIGKSRSAVANTLRLLDLPEDLLTFVASGELSAGHARALLSLDEPEEMIMVANRIIDEEMSVRDTERLVKKILDAKATEAEITEDKEVHIDYAKELENKMRKRLGRKVQISNTARKKAVTLYYEDNQDLENLLKLICGSDFIDEV